MTDYYIKIQIMTEQNSKNDWRKSQNIYIRVKGIGLDLIESPKRVQDYRHP
jgi:hypothetical protein